MPQWKEVLLKAVVDNFKTVVWGSVVVVSGITVGSFSQNLSFKRDELEFRSAVKDVVEGQDSIKTTIQEAIEESNRKTSKAIEANTKVLQQQSKVLDKLEKSVTNNIEAIKSLTRAVSDLRSWRAGDHLHFYTTQLHHEAILQKEA